MAKRYDQFLIKSTTRRYRNDNQRKKKKNVIYFLRTNPFPRYEVIIQSRIRPVRLKSYLSSTTNYVLDDSRQRCLALLYVPSHVNTFIRPLILLKKCYFLSTYFDQPAPWAPFWIVLLISFSVRWCFGISSNESIVLRELRACYFDYRKRSVSNLTFSSSRRNKSFSSSFNV